MALVVNPTAGRGRAGRALSGVTGRLRDAGSEPELWLSRDFAEARDLTTRAAASGVDVLAVMGGDGMMHLGVNACAALRAAGAPAPVLGLIPAGTGNDLCRGLGLDAVDVLAGVQRIVDGRVRAVDLAQVTQPGTGGEGVYVSTIVATGFDAFTNRRANALPWPRGGLRYPLAVLVELARFRPLHYRLRIDGEARELDAMLVAVGNTSTYGGGIRMCPDADPFDGLLDVTIIHAASRAKLLRLLPQTYSGKFVADPVVEQLHASTIEIAGEELIGFADGEAIDAPPFTIAQIPAAIEVLVADKE